MKKLSIIFLMIIAASCVTRKEAMDYTSDSGAIKIDVRIKGDFTKSNPYSSVGDPLAFNAGDRVFVTSEDGTIAYEYKKGGWSPTDNYYFRWGSEGLAFHASYPATAGSDYQNFTLPSNQSTSEKISYADYMTCDVEAIHNDGSGLLRFEMERRTARVIYTLVSVEEGEAVKGFKINSPIGIVKGKSSGETIMITPFVEVPEGGIRGGNGTKYVALVVPSDENLSEEQVTMVYKNAPVSFKVLPARLAGKQYEYQVKVEGDVVSISDPVVSDWTEGTIPGGNATPNRRFHWFVKPDGNGDGSSWENAMGPATLREMLATTGDDKERAALYDKTHFHFAGGSYDLSDSEGAPMKIEYSGYGSQVNISWDGGYNPSSTGTSLESRDNVGYETVFSGNGVSRILLLGNQTYLTFDGITFSNASSEAKGSAVFQAPGTSGNSTAVFNSCKFLSNKGATGAAICSNKGVVSCTDCLFQGNETTGDGGAIAFAGESLSLSSCEFKENSSGNVSHTVSDSSTGKGGALYLNSGSLMSVNMDKCIFSSNRAGIKDGADSKEYGGAIVIKNAEVSATLCEFTDNIGNRGSVVMMFANGGGLFKADRCSFHGNFQYSRGVCYILSKNMAMFSRCSFYDNTQRGNSSTWGESVQCGGTTAVCMNDCTLYSSKTGFGNNTASINTDGALCLVNNTIVSNSHQWVIRANTSGTRVLVNNIIHHSDASKTCYNGAETPAMSGFNIINRNFAPALTWDPSATQAWQSCFTWNGVLEGFTRAKAADITAGFEAFDVNASSWGGVLETISHAGNAFKSWLESTAPAGYTIDQRGTMRNNTGFWPGSYEE